MALKFVGTLPEDEVQARSQHKANAAELIENPGMWAEVGDYSKRATATSLAGDINKGKQSAYAKAAEGAGGKFEAEARTVGDGDDEANDKHLVFARYVAAATVTETAEDADEADAPDFE